MTEGVREARERTPAPWLRRAGELVGVRPDEAALLFAACLFQFSFVAGVAVLKAASNALLVGTTTLPLLYVASSLATGGVAALAAIARIPKRWPPTLTFAIWVVVLLGLTGLTHANVPYAVDALYLAAEVYATTLSVRFWGAIGELFDLRASRRVLGLIGGLGMAGSIAGGFLTRAVGESLGPLRLVPVACLSLVICLVFAPKLKRAGLPRTTSSPTLRPVEKGDARAYLTGDGLPRTMMIVAALFAACTAIADFLFRSRAKELLDHGAQTALFGSLSAVIGVVAMTTQLALTGPLLRRIGLFGYLALTPLLCLVFAGAALWNGGMWPAFGLKAVEQVGALSLAQTGMQLLYGPMPEYARGRARNAIDGFAKKGGYALGGLVLFAFATHLSGRAMPWMVIGVAFLAVVAILRVRAHYVRTIGVRLQSTMHADSEEVTLSDGTARKVLEKAAESENEGTVLTALELLARDRGAKLEPILVRLLDNRSARVRAEAAKLAADRGAQSCAVKLAQLALTDEPLVREAAIPAVAVLRPFTAPRLLGPLLQHPDLGTRAAVIAALVPLDPTGDAGRALDELVSLGNDANPGQRAQIARLLGRLGRGYAKRLRPYLHDPAALVRKAACEAAGASMEPELIDDLLQCLVARDTRPDARQALTRYGDLLLGRIEQILNDRHGSADLRYRIPRLLRDIGTSRALEVILFSNPTDDPFIQYRLSTAASRIREAHPEVTFDRQRALEATLRRLDAYEKLLPASRDLTVALGPRNLLVRAVNDRLDQHLDSAVRLAGLLGSQRAVQSAWSRFLHGDEKTRPYAVELLEHLIDDRGLSRRLTSALERWHRRPDWKDEGRLEGAPGRLLEFLGTRDVVLRAIAVATVRKLALVRGELPPGGTGGLPSGDGSGVSALARVARGPAWDVLVSAPPLIPEEGPVSEHIVQTVLFLEGVDIFAESDVDDLAAVAQYVKERAFRAGEVIFHENDPGDALFVIVEGKVRFEKGQKHIFDLGPRDSFGETSLLDHKPRPTTARALTDGKVLVLERADFMDLVSDRVELLRGIFGAITKHLRSVLDAASAGRITSPGLTPVSLPKVRQKTA
jgi:HEAT repeat protein